MAWAGLALLHAGSASDNDGITLELTHKYSLMGICCPQVVPVIYELHIQHGKAASFQYIFQLLLWTAEIELCTLRVHISATNRT